MSLPAKIRETCKRQGFSRAVVGMEPTGHYWKPLANWLNKQDGIEVVLVNTYATKQAKELDDNSQTKCGRKDALTIARLVKDPASRQATAMESRSELRLWRNEASSGLAGLAILSCICRATYSRSLRGLL